MSAGPLIRPATAGDLDAIAALAVACFAASAWSRGQLELALAMNSVRIQVADDPLGLLGFGVAQDVGGEIEIQSLAVSPAARRRGIAGRLLTALLPTGNLAVFLEVRASNLAAQSFYRHHGFTISGSRRGYYHDPVEDALVMVRRSPPR